METHLADFIKGTRAGQEAEAILRACVHCGFCTATCPTYQLLGDELDGPRGRIYLIKETLEGREPTARTQLHLDRCLNCRSCETTCPSGVQYSRLLDIGREVVEAKVSRRGRDRLLRGVLRNALPRAGLFAAALRLGRVLRPLLPKVLQAKVPERTGAGARPTGDHPRKMIELAGCVQPSMYPNINAAAARVLDRLGITLLEAPGVGCCGAVRFHLDDPEAAREDARRLIDAWLPLLEAGAEAIVMTASGCGVHVRDYGHLLQEDPAYAQKAARVAGAVRDLSQVIAQEQEPLAALMEARRRDRPELPTAFHSPCTLQHGQQIRGVVEGLLQVAGFAPRAVADGHLCCGAAGTYSLLEPELALRLRDLKVACLAAGEPAVIVSANAGCISHLQSGTALPVRHWIELIDQCLNEPPGGERLDPPPVFPPGGGISGPGKGPL
jgi:glycolate oxidase iron-sulfur subunit